MKICRIIVSIFFAIPVLAFSQQASDTYSVQFISALDSSIVPFVRIFGSINDSNVVLLEAGADGFKSFPAKNVQFITQLKTYASGYEPFYFTTDQLILNDTAVFFLNETPIVLKEITVFSYTVPLANPDVPTKNKKKKKGKEEEVITTDLYTAAEYATLDSLKNGTWFESQSKGITAYFEDYINYLASEIKYPEMAREKGIEDKIYVVLQLDEEGNIVHMRFLKAVSPLLAITTARVLVKFSRILPNEFNYGENTKQPKSVELILPVRFQLN